jgi:hypothetical protein
MKKNLFSTKDKKLVISGAGSVSAAVNLWIEKVSKLAYFSGRKGGGYVTSARIFYIGGCQSGV